MLIFSHCVAHISKALGSTDYTSGKHHRAVLYKILTVKMRADWSKLFRNASACATPEEGCYNVELAAQRPVNIATLVVHSGRKRDLTGPSELSHRPMTIKIASSQPVQNFCIVPGLQYDSKRSSRQ